MDLTSFFIGFVAGLAAIASLLLLFRLLLPWRRSIFCHARVSLFQIVGMQIRGHSPGLLVDTLIKLRMKGRTDIDIRQIERFFITNGQANMDTSLLVELLEQEFKSEE